MAGAAVMATASCDLEQPSFRPSGVRSTSVSRASRTPLSAGCPHVIRSSVVGGAAHDSAAGSAHGLGQQLGGRLPRGEQHGLDLVETQLRGTQLVSLRAAAVRASAR